MAFVNLIIFRGTSVTGMDLASGGTPENKHTGNVLRAYFQ